LDFVLFMLPAASHIRAQGDYTSFVNLWTFIGYMQIRVKKPNLGADEKNDRPINDLRIARIVESITPPSL